MNVCTCGIEWNSILGAEEECSDERGVVFVCLIFVFSFSDKVQIKNISSRRIFRKGARKYGKEIW